MPWGVHGKLDRNCYMNSRIPAEGHIFCSKELHIIHRTAPHRLLGPVVLEHLKTLWPGLDFVRATMSEDHEGPAATHCKWEAVHLGLGTDRWESTVSCMSKWPDFHAALYCALAPLSHIACMNKVLARVQGRDLLTSISEGPELTEGLAKFSIAIALQFSFFLFPVLFAFLLCKGFPWAHSLINLLHMTLSQQLFLKGLYLRCCYSSHRISYILDLAVCFFAVWFYSSYFTRPYKVIEPKALLDSGGRVWFLVTSCSRTYSVKMSCF